MLQSKGLIEGVQGLAVIPAQAPAFGNALSEGLDFRRWISEALLAQFHPLAGAEPLQGVSHQEHRFHGDAALLEVGFDLSQRFSTEEGVGRGDVASEANLIASEPEVA